MLILSGPGTGDGTGAGAVAETFPKSKKNPEPAINHYGSTTLNSSVYIPV